MGVSHSRLAMHIKEESYQGSQLFFWVPLRILGKVPLTTLRHVMTSEIQWLNAGYSAQVCHCAIHDPRCKTDSTCTLFSRIVNVIAQSLQKPLKTELLRKYNFSNYYNNIWHNQLHLLIIQISFTPFYNLVELRFRTGTSCSVLTLPHIRDRLYAITYYGTRTQPARSWI